MGVVDAVARFFARQASAPDSRLAPALLRYMAFETRRENAHALELLRLEPDHAVLEIGFGHGRWLRRLAKRVPRGFVAGVDPSARLVERAARRHRRAIARERIALQRGSAASLPFEPARFDRVLSAHTLYFWPDVEAGLREILRVLRPGGRLVLVFLAADESPGERLYPRETFRFLGRREVARALGAAGFRYVDMERRDYGRRRISFACAERPR
jgi:ubiquinone/menaquinone biosynthesis C-methylase UbiE